MMEKTKTYVNYDDSYTYRQILIGLRSEYLKFQKKLDQLSEYVLVFEDTAYRHPEKKDEYYFNLYQDSLRHKEVELAVSRVIIKKRLLEELKINKSPTRAFMVKDNNGIYYPLKKDWFEKYQFNIVIKPGYEKMFQECADEILNSDFARYMMKLDNNIYSVTDTFSDTSLITPNVTNLGFGLRTDKLQIKYYGRSNIMEFKSLAVEKEKWKPLTQECLDYVSSIRFPKDEFSEYHRSIIDSSSDDDRPVILSDDYKPNAFARFEIQDTPKKLVLTKTQSQRILK